MSYKINAREVLLYLNDLGYINVTAQQLKDFITDLKKLIKHEYRHGSSSPNYNQKTNGYYFDTKNKPTSNSKNITESAKKKKNEPNIFHTLHNHHTVSSRTKTVNSRDKHISVHITQPRHTKIHEHCIHVEKTVPIEEQIGSTVGRSESNVGEPTKVNGSSTELKTVTTDTIDHRPTSKQSASFGTSTSTSKSKPENKRSSVIKSSSSKSFNKCDPVTLYHQYKEEWKKIKFPGQDHHSDLRWAVREKLMSGPPVQIPLRRSSSKKKISNFN